MSSPDGGVGCLSPNLLFLLPPQRAKKGVRAEIPRKGATIPFEPHFEDVATALAGADRTMGGPKQLTNMYPDVL